jgi:tol-pal system protein YbgF
VIKKKEKIFSVAISFSLFGSILFLLTSCVTTGSVSDIERQLEYLRYDVNELKEASLEDKAESGATYDILLEEVKELRGTYEEKEYEIEGNTEELVVLKEVQNRTIADMESRFYAIEKRLAAIEAKLGIEIPTTTYDKKTPTRDTGEVTTGSPTVYGGDDAVITDLGDEELYKAAYKKFQMNDTDGAIKDFTSFINLYPNSALADNAHFWIGECYYSMKDYDRAILEYDKVIKDYPNADKVPSAMLKEGYALAEKGEIGSARVVLNDLIQKYPEEPQADLAKKKLEKL